MRALQITAAFTNVASCDLMRSIPMKTILSATIAAALIAGAAIPAFAQAPATTTDSGKTDTSTEKKADGK